MILLEFSLRVFFVFSLILHARNQFLKVRNFFEKIHGSNEADVGVQEQFHKCSIDQSCIYVAKKKESADYECLSVISSLDDYVDVWRKAEYPGGSYSLSMFINKYSLLQI